MGSVVAVSARSGHHFSKTPALSIRLLRGLGVAGDAHMGETVKHRSRVRRDPTQPNLRQVHLIHAELFSTNCAARVLWCSPPTSARTSPPTASICWRCRPARGCISAKAPWSRSPACAIPASRSTRFRKGLMAATLDRDADGDLVRKAGVMSIVISDGDVRPGRCDPRRTAGSAAPVRCSRIIRCSRYNYGKPCRFRQRGKKGAII